jgi:CRISPR type III-B/RAMP module-associated protein Cmr3
VISASTDLWSDEDRVGIERDDDTLAVRERALYTSRHVRPKPGVAIGVRINGIPDGWRERCAPAMPLGGEGRLVHVDDWPPDVALDVPWQVIKASGHVALVALTPLDYGPGRVLPGDVVIQQGGVTVVSACLPRVERVGGWASTGDRGAPTTLRSVLPAGSTLFCEVAEPAALRAAYMATSGVLRIGQWQRWGFGAVGLGVWPAKTDKQGEEKR